MTDKLSGNELAPEQSIKHLAVTFGKNLTFKDHIVNTVSACQHHIGKPKARRVKYLINKIFKLYIKPCLPC